MKTRTPQRARLGTCAAAAGLGSALLVGAAWAALGTAPTYRVSQNERAFRPGELTIQRGETVQIVNDDVVLHHAYVESSGFNFDSGDMKPGSAAEIVFSQPGTFTVLCGIHPKMKLVARVN